MSKRKKNVKQKLAEFTYHKPALEKRFLRMKHSFEEVSALLNEKKK